MKSNYLHQLTWLRGIAAFFVIVSHTLRATEVKYSPADEVANLPFFMWFDLGNFGVVLFFVLSGCTLYVSNAGRVETADLLAFYTKRFFRIWPAFAVSLFLYMGFRVIFGLFYKMNFGHWIEGQFLSSYSASDVFAYITLIFNFTGPVGLFNNAYWSLPVEFQYYIIFPVIVASVNRFGVIGPIVIGAFLYLAQRLGVLDSDQAEVFVMAFSFCGGVLVGYLYSRSSFRLTAQAGGLVLVALLAISSAISNSYIHLPGLPFLSSKTNWLGGIAIAAVFVVSISEIRFNRRVEDFLKYYGTISYSTYLYHNLVIGTVTLLAIKYGVHDSSFRLIGTFLFTILFTYFAAAISYRYVESPAITIGRRFSRRRNAGNK